MKQIDELDIQKMYFEIDEAELIQLGIEVPQEGEIIDILYIEDSLASQKSDKMHLFGYV